jgi:hypothetical protein
LTSTPQRFLTEHVQDVVRLDGPSINGSPARTLAFLHADVNATRQRVFARLGARLSGTTMILLSLDDAAVLDDAVIS